MQMMCCGDPCREQPKEELKEEGEVITDDDAFIDTIYSNTLRLQVPNHTHQCHVNLVTYRINELGLIYYVMNF